MSSGHVFILTFKNSPTKVRVSSTNIKVKKAKREFPESEVLISFEVSSFPRREKEYVLDIFRDEFEPIGKQHLFNIGSSSLDRVKQLASQTIERIRISDERWRQKQSSLKEGALPPAVDFSMLLSSAPDGSLILPKQNFLEVEPAFDKLISKFSKEILDILIKKNVLLADNESSLAKIKYGITMCIWLANIHPGYVITALFTLQICKTFEGFDKIIDKIFDFVKGIAR